MDSRQLTLDIRPPQQVSFDNFLGEANAELLTRLRQAVHARGFNLIYLWGAPGSGRTHLLRAAQAAVRDRTACFVEGEAAGAELPCPPGGVLLVDDVDRLGEAAQIALFRAFNMAAAIGLTILMSGPTPPLHLLLREDLRTRIGSALIYEVKRLTDDEKAAALARHAAARGMKVEDELIAYLLRHAPRDLPSLMSILDALDELSLEQQRPVTLALVRQVLNGM